jgi:type I restriction enzyme, S subunit
MKDLLERCFDTAFAAPDGIKKLRELILTLAMQGKLVPQDPNDPPAKELLKEIELTRSRETANGESKKGQEIARDQAGGSALRIAQGLGVGKAWRDHGLQW